MRDNDVKKILEREVELPDVVQQKMKAAYRQIGADTEKTERICEIRRRRSAYRLRYVKAAGIVFCCLLAAMTARAAGNGGFESLTKLFAGDTEVIKESSAQPEVTSGKNTFKHLKVSVEQVTGTDRLSYIILRLKRTDGKKFDKNKKYFFGNVSFTGEKDDSVLTSAGSEDDFVLTGAGSGEAEEAAASANADVCYSIWEDGMGSSEEAFIDNGMVIENQGTDEIRIVITCEYERREGKNNYYHKGEKCRLSLKGLMSDKGRVMSGEAQKEFALDYGECREKVFTPDVKIRLPEIGKTKQYLSVGTLKRVVLTPYALQFEQVLSEGQKENHDKCWNQVYVEMNDGSLIGQQIEQPEADKDQVRRSYGAQTRIKNNQWVSKERLIFSSLVDVDHVRAIWFGKQRIEV